MKRRALDKKAHRNANGGTQVIKGVVRVNGHITLRFQVENTSRQWGVFDVGGILSGFREKLDATMPKVQ